MANTHPVEPKQRAERMVGQLECVSPVGRVTEAPWDNELAAAMREHGIAVPEEQVTQRLLDELAR